MDLKPVRDQVVVVFGATGGIGRITALRFAERGARVVAAGRNREGLDSLVSEIRRCGGKAIGVFAEATDVEQVKNVAAEAVREYGHLDTWAHVAGVALWAKFQDITIEEFHQVMEVNFFGQTYGALAALPHLRREGRGALIHVSSVEALVSPPFQSAYAASKHALNGFLDSLRVELMADHSNISVTTVMPAGINTPLFNKSRCKLGVKPKPIPPMYEPELVADLIVYAAEHRQHRLYGGGGARFFMTAERWMPRLSDFVVRLTAIKGQKTDIPKPPGAPDNLFHTLPGYNRIRGDSSSKSLDHSIYDWFEMHNGVRTALTLSVLASAGIFAARRIAAARRA